ncbi:MAG: putative 2OG-Fe(II) oxygenase [Burkholderiaceae bacterium]
MKPNRHPLAPKGHVQVGVRKISIWPEGQLVGALAEPTVLLTDFDDTARYHPKLIERILAMENDPKLRDFFFRGGCGTKVRRPDTWGAPEAELIHRRAMALFRIVSGSESAVVDDCWASIYRTGDFCMPHSHVRTTASVLYLLDPGDDMPDPLTTGAPLDPFSGKFCFCDPRIRSCCQAEEGKMTNLFVPDLRAGSMLIFPSQWVHMVAAYLGTRPRISLSWNISAARVGGKPGAESLFARGISDG